MLSVNVWTTRRWSLPEAVAGYVARGIGGIGLWREKVAEIGLHPMFCADRAVVSTLAQALDMCDEIGAPNVGVCVDTYHVWWDPCVYQQIARAAGRIQIFQVCDFLVPIPADALLGRGHVGDGVADIPSLARAVADTGYQGPVEVEIFNSDVWDTPGDETLRILLDRHARYLEGILP